MEIVDQIVAWVFWGVVGSWLFFGMAVPWWAGQFKRHWNAYKRRSIFRED